MSTRPPGEPLHEHDCENCTYLGAFEGKDLYLCQDGEHDTVVARLSSDGPEYHSYTRFTPSDFARWLPPMILEAWGRAIDQHLVDLVPEPDPLGALV